MNIYPADKIQEWDQFTMEHEPISSLDLMERASTVFTEWFCLHVPPSQTVTVVCGPGNNGGDGLAVARLLNKKGYSSNVLLCQIASPSEDYHAQLKKLPSDIPKTQLHENDPLPDFDSQEIIIDAIFGSGLSRPVTGYWGQLVNAMNASQNIFAIDIPSGIFSTPQAHESAVKACRTLSFQTVKLSFLCPEYEAFIGDWTVKSIGLHPDYPAKTQSTDHYTELSDIHPLLRHRSTFSHKGDYGHGLLYAGSGGMIGASILSGRAALHAGLGLLSMHAIQDAYPILQGQIPEAMIHLDPNSKKITRLHPQSHKFQAIAIGPGIGTDEETVNIVTDLLKETKVPLILDADALNIIASHDLLDHIPKDTILTPHPGEFDRLFGKHTSHCERIKTASQQTQNLQCTIILKGAHTLIAAPDGNRYFNSTGNPGMATGGTGDTLTGILLGLRAQGYSSINTAKIGVFVHGYAGDLALRESAVESVLPTHIIKHLGLAFQEIRNGPSGRSSSPK